MIVNNYKKPKRMYFNMYYNKGYFYGRRNNYKSYDNSSIYYSPYKLQNYKKYNYYELPYRKKETYKKMSLLKDNSKKSRIKVENKNVEIKKKEKEINGKKCIIKILKRPTGVMNNEEPKKKICSKEKEDNVNIEVKEKKKKSKKTKTEKGAKIKQPREEFKFSSTQELFNLLLRDVKENSNDDVISNKGTENKRNENQREYAKKRNEENKIYHNKKIKNNSELKEQEKKNAKENYEISRKMEENNISILSSDKCCTDYLNNCNGNGGNNNSNSEEITTNQFYISLINGTNENYENNSSILSKEKKNKKNIYNNMNVENNNCKPLKIEKCYLEKDSYNKTLYNDMLKPISSKSLCSFSHPELLSHMSQIELCKNNSLKNEDAKNTKREEDANLFVIPLYMRSPKPEQIPIPIYLSEDGNKSITKEETCLKDKEKNNKTVNSSNIIKANNNIYNEYKDKTTNTYNTKTKTYEKNLREFLNINMYKENSSSIPKKNADKNKKNYRSFVSSNLEQGTKLYNDITNLNMGYLKKNNKIYNPHSHLKTITTNYNGGCSYNKNGKNFKIDKFFYNKKYKIKTNLNDNQKNRNFHFLKDVKIAVY